MGNREITTEYRLQKWAEVFAEREASGETISDFCLRKGISKYQYYYWLRKLRKAVSEGLAERQQPKRQTELAVRGFTEVMLAEPSVMPSAISDSQIRVEIGSCKITAGTGYPAETLVMLLRELTLS